MKCGKDDDGDSLNGGKGEGNFEIGGYFGDVVDKLKKPNSEPYIPPSQRLKRIKSSEIRLLPICLFSLATSVIEYDNINIDDTYYQLKIFASFVASDTLLRSIGPLRLGESTKLCNHLIKRSTASEMRGCLSRARIT